MKKSLLQIKAIAMVPLLTVLLLVSAHAGRTDTELFENSNRAYAEKKFDDAILGYEELIQKKTLSPSILLNLGNSYYSKGDVGRAVLYYERALLMNPSDPDVQANLEIVRKKAGLASPPEPNDSEWLSPAPPTASWTLLPTIEAVTVAEGSAATLGPPARSWDCIAEARPLSI